MRILAILLAFLFLSSCTAAQRAIITEQVKSIQQFNDDEARLLKTQLCAIRLGAYFRVLTDAERRAFDVLCGGQWERPLTAGDVRTLRDLGEFLKSSE